MKSAEKIEAIGLREKGYSLNEISELLKVSKSSVSLWVSKISLSPRAKRRLSERIARGQKVSAERKKDRTRKRLLEFYNAASEKFDGLPQDAVTNKFLCSMLYICEGGKHGNVFVQFTNSDPKLTQAFLKLFRNSFNIDEAKFRVCIHLHDYHDVERQLEYWHQITQIPLQQFIKPYIKKSAHHNLHENYSGCCQIRYYNSDVNKDLTMTGVACLDKIIGA